ncbi:Kinesin-like protein kif27 [Entophlyctis luteolus]|nr:Kinesin-like protein kif27 [Entophlyctis luteolus]
MVRSTPPFRVAMGKAEKGGGALLPTSLAETWLDRLTKFYLIPEGSFLTNWERFVVLLTMINCIIIPYMISFKDFYPIAWIISYFIDAVFLLDIYVKFHIAYLQNGLWVVFPKEMALNYLYSRQFCFDVFANLPVDLIGFGWAHDTDIALYVIAVARSVKMVRVVWLINYFRKQETKLHAGFQLQIVKFFCYLVTLEHCVACMWFAIACPHGTPDSCRDPSWVTGADNSYELSAMPLVVNGNWTASEWSIYVQSLYWTVTTMTTTGYGDITAKNDGERVFSLVTMILGVLFYGYVSGTIASSLSNMDSRRVAYHQKMDAIKQYMNDRDMDSDMQERVLEYYDYMWERNKGIDVKNLFEDMPSTFKSEVALSLNAAIIDKSAIFLGTSIGFRRKIAISMKLYLFTANEYVIHKGDLGSEMFFITQGRIDIFWTTDLLRPTASLIEGAHFGEFQTILGHKHEYSARAVCNTDIYVLSREDIEAAFSAFPKDKKVVMEITSRRYQVALSSRKTQEFSAADIESEFGSQPAPPIHAGSMPASISGKRRASNGFLIKSTETVDEPQHVTSHSSALKNSTPGSRKNSCVIAQPEERQSEVLLDFGSAIEEVDYAKSPDLLTELLVKGHEPRISESEEDVDTGNAKG